MRLKIILLVDEFTVSRHTQRNPFTYYTDSNEQQICKDVFAFEL